MTREDILRNFPNAKEDFIRANLGNNGHAVGYSQQGIADLYEKQMRDRRFDDYLKQPVNMKKAGTITSQASVPKNAQVGQWFEIGGKRFFSRSLYERNYACYLAFLKDRGHILDWEYEPETFWFEGICRGTNNYKPDFRVTDSSGQIEYREVKGFFDRKSRTKIKRFRKYFPKLPLRVIDGTWFKQNGRSLARIVPGWATKARKK